MASAKRKFWASDWFAGLLIVLALAFVSQCSVIQGLERSAYDMGVRSADRDPGDDIAIIAIDDTSLDNIGRWPWARTVHAEMIDKLAAAGARAVGFTILLSEPQIDPGLQLIRQLREFYQQAEIDALALSLASDAAEQAMAENDDSGEAGSDNFIEPSVLALLEFGEHLEQAEEMLDTDSRLAESIAQAGNVVMGMQLVPGRAHGNAPRELPDFVRGSLIQPENVMPGAAGGSPMSTINAIAPIAQLGEPAAAIGHIVNPLDVDGAIRFEPLILDYYGDYVPSMSLQLAARSLRLDNQDISVILGEDVLVGGLRISTNNQSMLNSFFYTDRDGRPPFPEDSFYDVYSGRIDASKYRDKVVIIGATAFGLGSSLSTPISGAMEPAQILAHSVASILNEDFFIRPPWAGLATWGAFLLIALYLMFGLSRLGAGLSAGISLALLLVLVGSEVIVMAAEGIWIPLMLPATLLFSGHLLLTTKGFLLSEKGRFRFETESAESNRMLGLAFQQQGQLDMAFEKFRRAPLNDELMDPLYNLALDFERKRQFNKAASVYEYMAGYEANFRDIAQRRKRATDAQDTVIFGARSGGGATDTLLGEGTEFEKPMLGRYQVEKELGRGAMGIVYQGRDPKINRVVAIKTLALSDEFEDDELQEVKERFFREAEAAGKLNHPNIVTVFDAGEEHDLAYIAMEFLHGHDLVRYTKPEALMPPAQVLELIASAAEALDYAHKQQIVHRDIKPANLMYDPESGALKLTDFGIARISNISRTKTGMVAGTPSFMSPEQVRGQKVDGRSDIFSLGITLYQLLTGDQPFEGEDATQIMFKIATEPHVDIFQRRPGLKRDMPWITVVINRALEKDLEKRYQNGAKMAKDLRTVLQKMDQSGQ